MTIRPVPRIYHYPISQNRWARNGVVPDYRVGRYPTVAVNHALAHLRKVVFCKSVSPDAAPQGTSSVVPWRWNCRTGAASTTAGQLVLTAVATVAPADNTSGGADPRWRFVIDDGSATNSAYRHYPVVVTSPTMDDVIYQTVSVNADADTVYACHVELEERLRLLALTVYEFHVPFVDSADTGSVCAEAEYAFDAEITDAQHSNDFVTTPHNVWRKNASHLWSLAPETEAGFWERSTNSYVNMLVTGASTTVGANTPGFNPQVRYYNPAHTSDVPCGFAVYAANTNGSGGNGTGAGGDVRLVSQSGGTLVTLTNFTLTAAGAWKTGTCVLDGTVDTDKVDIHFQGDGTNTLVVEAVSLYAYTT